MQRAPSFHSAFLRCVNCAVHRATRRTVCCWVSGWNTRTEGHAVPSHWHRDIRNTSTQEHRRVVRSIKGSAERTLETLGWREPWCGCGPHCEAALSSHPALSHACTHSGDRDPDLNHKKAEGNKSTSHHSTHKPCGATQWEVVCPLKTRRHQPSTSLSVPQLSQLTDAHLGKHCAHTHT